MVKYDRKIDREALPLTRRFCEMAAVTPQKKQCLIASSPPAASLLSAATSQSRWDVICHFEAVQCENEAN
jgi:hypothetical protein